MVFELKSTELYGRVLIQCLANPECNQFIGQLLVLISMFSVVVFNIITIIICQSKSDQIEIILTGPCLTITSFP